MPEGTFKDDDAIPKGESIGGEGGLPPLLVMPGYGPPEPKEPPSFKKLMWRLVFALGLMLVVLSAVAAVASVAWNTSTLVTGAAEINFQTAFCLAVIWRLMSLTWRM